MSPHNGGAWGDGGRVGTVSGAGTKRDKITNPKHLRRVDFLRRAEVRDLWASFRRCRTVGGHSQMSLLPMCWAVYSLLYTQILTTALQGRPIILLQMRKLRLREEICPSLSSERGWTRDLNPDLTPKSFGLPVSLIFLKKLQ